MQKYKYERKKGQSVCIGQNTRVLVKDFERAKGKIDETIELILTSKPQFILAVESSHKSDPTCEGTERRIILKNTSMLGELKIGDLIEVTGRVSEDGEQVELQLEVPDNIKVMGAEEKGAPPLYRPKVYSDRNNYDFS
jgi:sRNA-binding carbon storage regulator CsrA